MEDKAVGDIIFHDRGIVDGYAYCRICGVPAPQPILDNARNRYDKIFFLETLNMYVEDGVRSRTLEDAGKIHAEIKEAYLQFGYEPITIPVLPPEQRVDFILNLIR